MEGDRRHRRKPDHPHPDRRQLLAHGRYRTLRTLLRDLLRPWRSCAGRSSGLARRGWRPLRRDLEPGLHAVFRGPAGHPHAAAAPLDRHRHGAGALRRHPAGQAGQLRHRHVARPDHGLRGSHRTGAGRAVQDQSSRGGRSPALGLVPDRRRRAAGQGRPRLRAAPDHAPGDAPFASDGYHRGGVPSSGAGPGAADGSRLPRAGPGGGADTRNHASRGGPLQGPARTRPVAARRRDLPSRQRGTTARRGRVQAIRHLRLSIGPDPGCVARARPVGRSGRFRERDGGTAAARPRGLVRLRGGGHRTGLFRVARAVRQFRVPRLRDRAGRCRDHGVDRGWRAARHGVGRRDGRGAAQPDAVLCRKRRPGRGRWPHHGARVDDRDHRHAEEARRVVHPCRAHRRGAGQARRAGDRDGGPFPARQHPGASFGDAPAA